LQWEKYEEGKQTELFKVLADPVLTYGSATWKLLVNKEKVRWLN